MIDDTISWRHHISYICSRISRGIGILSKLRHYLSIKHLSQIYYSVICPYISYAVLAWGSACTSLIQKVRVKQDHEIRLIFFVMLYNGNDTVSALPLLNLLDILTVQNVYRPHAMEFIHASWHKGLLPHIFDNFFQYSRDVHCYNTIYSSNLNMYKPYVRTNTGKQAISFGAINLSKDLPDVTKNLPLFSFFNQAKTYLLARQNPFEI